MCNGNAFYSEEIHALDCRPNTRTLRALRVHRACTAYSTPSMHGTGQSLQPPDLHADMHRNNCTIKRDFCFLNPTTSLDPTVSLSIILCDQWHLKLSESQ